MNTTSSMRLIVLCVGAAVVGVGCKGGEPASCEITVASTPICLESEMSIAFCEDDAGGKATDVDESTCSDLGYTVECSGSVEQNASDTTASLPYWAKTEEDCEAADGQSFET